MAMNDGNICSVCGLPAFGSHHDARLCVTHLDRAIREVGPGPEQLPVRRCRRCGGWIVRHDDIVPWRCTDCDELLQDGETELQVQPGSWSA